MSKDKDVEVTQSEEVVETPKVDTPEVVKTPTEATIESLEETPKAKVVPEAAFLKKKQQVADLKAELEELKNSDKSGAEVSADLASLSEEFGVDAKFLEKLSKSVRAETAKEFEGKLKPLQEKEKAEARDKKFNEFYGKAMENLPELSEVVNASVIKSLANDPANKNKTFTQLILDTYGNTVPGKRTIETTQPGGGKEPQKLDSSRASSDPAYFKQVMSDPVLKAEYNAQMIKNSNF